jgi:anti-anti-sigma regulatory factor
MVLVTANKYRRLLCLQYVQRVTPAELAGVRDELKAVLADLPPDFRLLADLGQVEFMDPACADELGAAMELIGQHSVSLIVRVIPDPAKDIGLNILTIFHYPHHPRLITCETLAEALQRLAP